MTNATRTSRPTLTFEPGVDDPQEHFGEAYRIYRLAIERVVRQNVQDRHLSLVEDLTADTFTRYWRTLILAGRPVVNAGGLLRVMARREVVEFYRVKRNTEYNAYDLTDPVNTPILAQAAVDITSIPELASLTDELNVAMERMTAASQEWKAHHKATVSVVNAGLGGQNRAAQHPKWAERIATRREQEAQALVEFRTRCERVAKVRAEINRAEDALCR